VFDPSYTAKLAPNFELIFADAAVNVACFCIHVHLEHGISCRVFEYYFFFDRFYYTILILPVVKIIADISNPLPPIFKTTCSL
jgi:hypothetical protein